MGGDIIQAHGPYEARFMIDGVKIITTVHVTDDQDFQHKFLLSSEIWTANSIKFTSEKIIAEKEMPNETEKTTKILKDQDEFKKKPALIDTGTGPSLMTIKNI